MASLNGIIDKQKKIPNIAQTSIIEFKPISDYGTDNYESVQPPIVTRRSAKMYEDYIWSPYTINSKLTPIKNANLMGKYISYAS